MNSSISDLANIPISIPLVSSISIFTASRSISTIVSIPNDKAISTRIIEPKVQPSVKILGKGKELEENIDLDEEIVIPQWDILNMTPDQMHTFGKLLQKKNKTTKTHRGERQRIKDYRRCQEYFVRGIRN